MNIFYLDSDPIEAARCHVDRHVVKMVLETAQLLSTAKAFYGEGDPGLYKPTHVNHPCAVWTRASRANYAWLFALFAALLEEYTFRYGKTHASSRLLTKLAAPPAAMPDLGLTAPAMAMDDAYVVPGDPIASYRNYYRHGKAHLHTWTKRTPPAWIRPDEKAPIG